MKQFEESLATTDSALKEAHAEAKALAKQALGVEQAMHAATEEIQATNLHLCLLYRAGELKEVSHEGYAGLDRRTEPFLQQGLLHAS